MILFTANQTNGWHGLNASFQPQSLGCSSARLEVRLRELEVPAQAWSMPCLLAPRPWMPLHTPPWAHWVFSLASTCSSQVQISGYVSKLKEQVSFWGCPCSPKNGLSPGRTRGTLISPLDRLNLVAGEPREGKRPAPRHTARQRQEAPNALSSSLSLHHQTSLQCN